MLVGVEERKLEVLRAIVADFIATNEPVGSKALVERHRLGVSPASAPITTGHGPWARTSSTAAWISASAVPRPRLPTLTNRSSTTPAPSTGDCQPQPNATSSPPSSATK